MGHALLVQQKPKKNLQIQISSFPPSTKKKGIFTQMWKMVIDCSKGLWPMGGTGTWDERGDTGGKERVTSPWSVPRSDCLKQPVSIHSKPKRQSDTLMLCPPDLFLIVQLTITEPSLLLTISVTRKDHVICPVTISDEERSRDVPPPQWWEVMWYASPLFSEGDGWNLPIYAFSLPLSLLFIFNWDNCVKIEFQMEELSRTEETLYSQVT